MAFDAKGGLWLADSTHSVVKRISAEASYFGDLGTIDLTPYRIAPYALAFDKSENLWVAGQDMSPGGGAAGNAVLIGFDGTKLGDLKATAASRATSIGIYRDGNPETMAFSAAGDLWMALPRVASVGGVTPTLSSTGNQQPFLLTDTTFNPDLPKGSNPNPTGVAFDWNGNLWVTNQAANEVVGFAKSGSSVGSTPSYHIDLPPWTVNGTNSPKRVAMDPCFAHLYVLTSTAGDEHIYSYDIADPAAPKLVATVTVPDFPQGVLTAFVTNPIPEGMPLYRGSGCGK